MGGLGVKNLRVMNKALLAKLTWLLIHHPNQLWIKILISKYGSPLGAEEIVLKHVSHLESHSL